MPRVDWGVGSYEHTARDLEPVSRAAVEAASVGPGRRVLDVACGTGNAALAAAARGAEVAGLDGAPRLLEVARTRAQEAGVRADWRLGDVQALPWDDGSFDAALSVFGVIFAEEGRAAAAELVRVVEPGGVVVVTSWPPHGPLAAVIRLMREVAAGSEAARPGAAALDWGDPEQLRAIFAPAEVSVEERAVAFTGDSAREYVERQSEYHPAWAGVRAALPAERYARLLDESTAILAEANEDPGAFRVSVPYLLTVARP